MDGLEIQEGFKKTTAAPRRLHSTIIIIEQLNIIFPLFPVQNLQTRKSLAIQSFCSVMFDS